MTNEFLNDCHYTVVDAADPDNIISQLPLSLEEANDMAYELNRNSYDVTFIVVELGDE